MIYELLLLIEKHLDMLIGQTKTKPQAILEYKLNRQMKTFSINPPVNFSEERRRLLAVVSFEATNSFFTETDESKNF